VKAERGAREFASGDRIMFLKNERGLGVKNGTLGKVERVSPEHMAVRLDDGRSVAFDLKDYAHVDHGYAATIHKSQGVTVDRAHVLATPGMDRHSAYVGCRGTVTGCSSIMAATTSPISASLSAPCRASGRRIWRAREALDAIRPNASTDLGAALQRQPELVHEAAEGRGQAAMRAMQLEAEIRADPFQRADRFVEGWQQLQRHREDLQRDGDFRGAKRVAQEMHGMAKGLERDAQMESVLRGRTRELGIDMEMGRSLARDLADSVPFDHGRNLGMSR
jgi:hypothetical protein